MSEDIPYCDACNLEMAIVRTDGIFLCELCFKHLLQQQQVSNAIYGVSGSGALSDGMSKDIRCKICENKLELNHKCKDKSRDCCKFIGSLPTRET